MAALEALQAPPGGGEGAGPPQQRHLHHQGHKAQQASRGDGQPSGDWSERERELGRLAREVGLSWKGGEVARNTSASCKANDSEFVFFRIIVELLS